MEPNLTSIAALPDLPMLATPWLRPARACDADAVGDFIERLSPHSRMMRFHGGCSGLSDAMRKLLCDVDGVAHQAWLAWIGVGEHATVIGEARFVIVSPGADAELAIVVADDWMGTGLANTLMQRLLVAAHRSGVGRLYGEVMDDNSRMRAFMRRHRFTSNRLAGGGLILMSRDLRPIGMPSSRASAMA